MWLRYGQIDEENKINGIGRRIRIDYWSGSSFAERWCYIEDGQFVDDHLVGFGRRLMMWNSSFMNRIGWGIDNGARGRDADNFKLEGLGDRYNKDGKHEIGKWENDALVTGKDDLDGESQDQLDFKKFLLTQEEVDELREALSES